MFDVVEKSFTRLPDLPMPRMAAACGSVLSPNGDRLVVLAGGIVSSNRDLYTKQECPIIDCSRPDDAAVLISFCIRRSSVVFVESEWAWRGGPDLPVPLAASTSLEEGSTFLLAGGYMASHPFSTPATSLFSRALYRFELYRTWWSAIFSPSWYYERWTERTERLQHGTAECPMFWVPNSWCHS